MSASMFVVWPYGKKASKPRKMKGNQSMSILHTDGRLVSGVLVQQGSRYDLDLLYTGNCGSCFGTMGAFKKKTFHIPATSVPLGLAVS